MRFSDRRHPLPAPVFRAPVRGEAAMAMLKQERASRAHIGANVSNVLLPATPDALSVIVTPSPRRIDL